MKNESMNKAFVLLLVLFISAVFLSMIRHFLMAILMAGIFSALARPTHRRFERWFRGRRGLASVATLLLIVMVILIPLGTLMGVITSQAINVGHSVSPWVEKQIKDPSGLSSQLEVIPYYDKIRAYQEPILRKVGQLVGTVSGYLINGLSSFTLGTVNFLFMIFIMLYSMYFFLLDGDKFLAKLLYYLPLKAEDEERLLERFTSVTRATLKGTAVIGLLQGGLAGLAFAVVGIQGAVFWGAIMVVLSTIPAVGTGLVWFPAAVILVLGGHYAKGVGLALFCGLAVGSIDNVLRPALVGRDTQMHDLFILFGTLGGLAFFGFLGIIIGPIVAALFVTAWDIYGVVFRDVLPATSPLATGSTEGSPNRNAGTGA
jgi:predicted PurR-regulated permease PerM